MAARRAVGHGQHRGREERGRGARRGSGGAFEKGQANSQYVFARLEARAIQKLVELDLAAAKAEAERRNAKSREPHAERARSMQVSSAQFSTSGRTSKFPPASTSPIATVKADAAQNSFSARGAGITWAVMDSGIDTDSSPFRKTQQPSTQISPGIRTSPSMAAGHSKTRTATERMLRGLLPASGACRRKHRRASAGRSRSRVT